MAMPFKNNSNNSQTDNKPMLLSDIEVVQRIFEHIDNTSTDMGSETWKEPVTHYKSEARLRAEVTLLQNRSVVFCPSAALAKPGDFVSRDAAGIPLIAIRGLDGKVRAFKNACRHRGVQLVNGLGCTRALVCPYHGWAYGLDGSLRHIPHEDGFPDVDKATRGLISVVCMESNGLVFINQNPQANIAEHVSKLPMLLPEGLRLLKSDSQIIEANWKLYLESSLEGYHIRETHKGTFFPVQYDNLTVVETFAENNRIAFPYQSIEGLRKKPKIEWTIDGRLTYVYHLFPNVIISTFPGYMQVVILEPLELSKTQQHTYIVSNNSEDDTQALDIFLKSQEFAAKGAIEDQKIVLSAQQGLLSGANQYLEFGLFESAIGRLHSQLAKEIGAQTET
jgi:phenylpropionate dioxygenase-like ring-hydroxylating dioxygenase large terminal subunit